MVFAYKVFTPERLVCFLVSFDSSEVPTPTEFVHLLLTILFSCRIFGFLRFGAVSLPCEWSWAIRLSAAIHYCRSYG
jgi:hypothetical protein